MAALSEAEIRPDEWMAGQEAAFADDIARLMGRRSEFVAVRCPACAGSRSTPRFDKQGMGFVSCDRCGTIYANPRPPTKLLADHYATSQNYTYFNRHIFPASEGARRKKIFRPRVDRLRKIIERHGSGSRTLLEVGAGFGTFCEELRAQRLFDRIIAVEPTPDLAATCRSRGLEVIEAPIERIAPGDLAAGVVVAFEVIEHLFAPRDFVSAALQILSSGGLLVLTCPNGRGFDIELLGPVSDAVDVEHLNLFNPTSLSVLLQSSGLEVLEITTPGQLDAELVRKKALAGLFDLSIDPFMRRVLIDEWDRLGAPFQRFLAENGLSSHMWAVARKPA